MKFEALAFFLHRLLANRREAEGDPLTCAERRVAWCTTRIHAWHDALMR